MSYRLADHWPHLAPIPKHHKHEFVYRYHVTFMRDTDDLSEAARYVQDTFPIESGVEGQFEVVLKEGDTWHVVFERYGCEEDYHRCVHASGHDGSDKAAIRQLQDEIDETTLVANEFVVQSRSAIPEGVPYTPLWDRENLLVKSDEIPPTPLRRYKVGIIHYVYAEDAKHAVEQFQNITLNISYGPNVLELSE